MRATEGRLQTIGGQPGGGHAGRFKGRQATKGSRRVPNGNQRGRKCENKESKYVGARGPPSCGGKEDKGRMTTYKGGHLETPRIKGFKERLYSGTKGGEAGLARTRKPLPWGGGAKYIYRRKVNRDRKTSQTVVKISKGGQSLSPDWKILEVGGALVP